MKIYDISMPIQFEMPVYKGKPSKRPLLKVESDFTTGTAYETKIEMNMHTGTHIDRSLHMIEGGTTVESLDLSKVVTNCRVIDVTEAQEKISKEHLQDKKIKAGEFVLLKTKNSFEDILEGNFIYVDRSAAEYLQSKGVVGVGIDALGIERAQPEHETHITLLSNDIVILEGLRLKHIPEDEYFLVAAPLNIIGAEGSPCRAILIKDI